MHDSTLKLRPHTHKQNWLYRYNWIIVQKKTRQALLTLTLPYPANKADCISISEILLKNKTSNTPSPNANYIL
jgi:hypothetical protein